MLFLQPAEIDYLQDLKKHGVSLTEYPLLKVLDSFPMSGHKNMKNSVFIDMHPWIMCLQKALESFLSSKVIILIASLIEFYICVEVSQFLFLFLFLVCIQ